jgi:hypothetical protein
MWCINCAGTNLHRCQPTEFSGDRPAYRCIDCNIKFVITNPSYLLRKHMKLEVANLLLPQSPTTAIRRPERLKYLIIAPPKFGKTTFFAGVEDSVLLAFEEGHAFVSTHKIIIDQWDRTAKEKLESLKPAEEGGIVGWGTDEDGNVHTSMQEAMEAIISSDRFQFVIFDTADMMTKMCVDYHCKQRGVSHPSEAGDFGKGYDLTITNPLRQMIGPIIKSGRGVAFITHTKLVTKKIGATEVSKWETTLPSQAQHFLHTQADVILYGAFGKRRPGMDDRDRILSLDGSNETIAGTRVKKAVASLPKKYIVDPDEPWAQWSNFFDDPEAAERENLRYNELVLGKKAKEVEQVVAEAEANPEPTPISAPVVEAGATPPPPVEGEFPSEEPAHMQTPRVVRQKKAAVTV